MAIRNPLLKAIPAVATKSDPDIVCRLSLQSVVKHFRLEFDSDAKSSHHDRPMLDAGGSMFEMAGTQKVCRSGSLLKNP